MHPADDGTEAGLVVSRCGNPKTRAAAFRVLCLRRRAQEATDALERLEEVLKDVTLEEVELHAPGDVEAARLLRGKRPTSKLSDVIAQAVQASRRPPLMDYLRPGLRKTGDVLRFGFRWHVASLRGVVAHVVPGLRGADVNAEDTFASPVLQPLLDFFVTLAAPESLYSRPRLSPLEWPRPVRMALTVVVSVLRRIADPGLREGVLMKLTDAVSPGPGHIFGSGTSGSVARCRCWPLGGPGT